MLKDLVVDLLRKSKRRIEKMVSGEAYSTLARLLQIEGPSFADNVAAEFESAGVPRDRVEEVLTWAIGDDFHRILLQYWPHRLRDRIKLDVRESDRIKDTIPKIAKAWHDHNRNT